MPLLTGPGPYRPVPDEELRWLFYLTPQSGKFIWSVRVNTAAFPGAERPEVTPLLRAMLYTLQATPAQLMELRRTIERTLASRELIPIRMKLLSHIRLIQQEPWAFPVCMDTPRVREYYRRFQQVSGASGVASDFGSDPLSNVGISGAFGRWLRPLVGLAAGFTLQSINFFGGRSKDYYDALSQRMLRELDKRGVPMGAVD